MIELSPTTAVNLYLALTLTLLLSLWGFHHYSTRRKKIIAEDNELLVCEFCHFAYLAEIGKAVTKCPQCTSFNKNNKFRK